MDSAIYDQEEYERYEYDAQERLINTFQKDYGQSEILVGESLKFDDQYLPSSAQFSHFTVLMGDNLVVPTLRLPLPGLTILKGKEFAYMVAA